MIVGGLAEVFLGVAAEGKSLEEVAAPLTLIGAAEPMGPPGIRKRRAIT
jgi:hypothetical protein